MSIPVPAMPLLDSLLSSFEFSPTPPLTAAMARVLFRSLVVCHELLDLFPGSRPLVQLLGPPGSGKTTLARLIGRIISGPEFDIIGVPSVERDLWPVIQKAHPGVLDNLEEPPKWFADVLARATSGAAYRVRKLYSNDDVVEFRAKSFIWTTSFSGGAARGDLLDRSLIFRLGRNQRSIPEERMFQVVEDHHAEFRGEIERVAAEVRERRANTGPQRDAPPGAGRNADFAIYGHVIAEIAGGERDATLFDAGMALMDAERFRVAGDGEPLRAAAFYWAAHWENRDVDGSPGAWINTTALLQKIASVTGGVRDFDSTARDAARLGRFLTELSRSSAGIIDVERRIRHGKAEYRIRLARPLPPGYRFETEEDE